MSERIDQCKHEIKNHVIKTHCFPNSVSPKIWLPGYSWQPSPSFAEGPTVQKGPIETPCKTNTKSTNSSNHHINKHLIKPFNRISLSENFSRSSPSYMLTLHWKTKKCRSKRTTKRAPQPQLKQTQINNNLKSGERTNTQGLESKKRKNSKTEEMRNQ